MHLSYDPRRNIAYLRLRPRTGELEAVRVSDEITVDLAPDGTVAGIEFLNANAQLLGDGGRLVVSQEGRSGEDAVALHVA